MRLVGGLVVTEGRADAMMMSFGAFFLALYTHSVRKLMPPSTIIPFEDG